MLNYLKTAGLVGGLAIGLAACGNGGGVTLTPQPPSNAVTYYQIERLSRPAIKEVFEPFVDHQKSNVAEPYADPTIAADITATANALRPPNAAAGTNYGTTLASILYPDAYMVNLDGATGGFLGAEVPALNMPFGGRKLQDDVVGLELGILFGNTLQQAVGLAEDNEENNCLSTQNLTATAVGPTPSTSFPYLAAAH